MYGVHVRRTYPVRRTCTTDMCDSVNTTANMYVVLYSIHVRHTCSHTCVNTDLHMKFSQSINLHVHYILISIWSKTLWRMAQEVKALSSPPLLFILFPSPLLIITGSAVALHCCKAYAKIGKWEIRPPVKS